MISNHPSVDADQAIFVTAETALSDASGGVQVYTRELMETFDAARLRINTISHGFERRWPARLRRKMLSRPYADRVPAGLLTKVVERQHGTKAKFIFLNGVDLAALAGDIRAALGRSVSIALFSYGLESVDYLHTSRASSQLASSRAASRLGRQLFAECSQRRNVDIVFCLAPFEAEIERWLGARRVEWLPRTINDRGALDWRPVGNRLGCISTLDHPPNHEGLDLLLQELTRHPSRDFRFRLIGGPPEKGDALARSFRCVDYLGPLDDRGALEEVATWNAFVHPLFCYARGCSTKLAVALAWGIPIVTTPQGARGYVWRDGVLPMAETPPELARLCFDMLNLDHASSVRSDVQRVAVSSPTTAEVAERLARALAMV